MIIDHTLIRWGDRYVLFCGICGRPMRVCRAQSIQCSAPPKAKP